MAKLYETINAENWIKGEVGWRNGKRIGNVGCLFWHVQELYSRNANEVCRLLDDTAMLLFPERASTRMLGLRPAPYVNDHPDTTLEDVLRICKFADV